MKSHFDMAIGCVTGSEHSRLGLTCQDSYATVRTDSYVCGVVSDGCSGIPEVLGTNGHPRTEVGAAVLSRLTAKIVSECLEWVGSEQDKVDAALLVARQRILDNLVSYALTWSTNPSKDALAEEMGGLEWPVNTAEMLLAMYFSATIVGFFASDSLFVVFSIGDGYYAVNGAMRQLDTFDKENNAPAYLIYSLLPEIKDMPQSALQFRASVVCKPEDVKTAMVATDGVRFMIGQDDVNAPGKALKVGSVTLLWDDRMFVNKDMLRRKLALLNKDVSVPDWVAQTMVTHSSILKDDVAVISIRRTP